MAKKKTEDTINLDSILFKCRDILRAARNSGSFFEKRDMMLTLVFLRFIGEKYEDGIEKLRQILIEQGLDPDDENIRAAFFDDATFADGTYNLPPEARWSTIINTPAPKLNVALDNALHSIAAGSKQLKGCFVEGTFTTRNLAANDIKKNGYPPQYSPEVFTKVMEQVENFEENSDMPMATTYTFPQSRTVSMVAEDIIPYGNKSED